MDILFVNAQEGLSLKKEVNGTLLLATKLLQADFQVDVLRFGQIPALNQDFESFIGQITKRILDIAPRCLSLYTLALDFHIMLRIACEVKAARPETILVMGGPQTSGTGEEILRCMPYIDYVCTGEGENTVVPFFTAVLRDGAALDTIPGLCYRKDGKVVANHIDIPLCDLETLPQWDTRLLPEYSGEDMQSANYLMPIDAGRGCPYNCSFCCTSYFWRRMYRLKSPERIVADIRYYYDNFGIRSFYFSHDAFTINQKLVSQVCDGILSSGMQIHWRCTARVDCLTEELILKMKSAGLNQIELGVESGSAKIQKLIHKNLNLEKAQKTIAFLLEQGIKVTTFFMYGLPQETEQDLNETLELIFTLVDMGIHGVSMSYCMFTPTTELTQQYFDQLVMDPKIKVITEGTFGFREELDVIRENKSLFPFFYHLPTPQREKFQYLDFFVDLYYRFPETVQELRKCYKGDNLRFYCDMIRNNPEIFSDSIENIEKNVREKALQILLNTASDLDVEYAAQLKSMLTFSYDVREVGRMGNGGMILKNYDFYYPDFKQHLPMAEFGKGQSQILIRNVGGHLQIKPLAVVKL